MKILFIIPYPLQESPSQRFRFEQYFEVLKNRGHQLRVHSFLSSDDWLLFYSAGHSAQKSWALIKGFLKRGLSLITAYSNDLIFIHREAAPMGPPIFEWIIARLLRKKIIYDFDDAIWLTDRVNESGILKILKWRNKVQSICRWSYKVSCGNQYLTRYALQFNGRVVTNPTTIDCTNQHNPALFEPRRITDQIVIGWTGSHSTLKYLQLIEPVLQKLENQFTQVSFLVIADQAPSLNLNRLSFIKWNPETEIQDLLKMDIGIMPLPDDEWAKGKCGFKALQYMSLEIPVVMSPVGVNSTLIRHGVEGFLCQSDDEWLFALGKLITDKNLRREQGKQGRKKVIEDYSVSSNTSTFLSLFE